MSKASRALLVWSLALVIAFTGGFMPSLAQTDMDEALVAEHALLDESDTFFDDSIVHEIYLTFDPDDYGSAGWYNTLYDSHANDPEDPYFPASFEGDGVTIDQVGVRFKGNSSFSSNSVKKSFKIDFDEYDEDNDALVFYDLKKLNLNNGFKDPTMLREKVFLDFAGQFVAAPRAVHTKVYVNGAYYGLYIAVEQVDKTFVQNRFGDDEDGNLFKGATDDAVNAQDDFNSDLTWLGSDEAAYDDFYELKTNETAYDYSQLVEFIDVLNNTSPSDFPTDLEPLCDVDDVLQGLALNNLFVNLDSYNGAAHNYYLYDRDDTGKFTHIPWDANESFGRFLMFMSAGDSPLTLDPFWLPTSSGPGGGEERPLMENLWANDDYRNDYLCHLQDMLDSGFDEATMTARIDELADIIRDDLYADPNKLYSNNEFETNLHSNVQDGRDTIYGLSSFVGERADSMQADLARYDFDCTPDMLDLTGTLYLNEFMADNDTALEDPGEPDDYPDWIELYNASSADVDLNGLFLTDDLADPTVHAITQTLIVPAQGYVVLYADNDVEQGVEHLGFKLGSSGEDLALYNSDGATLIDSTTFGEQTTDVSEGRCPDGGDTWVSMATATPGESNEPCGQAPTISSVSHAPAQPTATDDVQVSATVTDDGAVATVTLWYSVGGDYVSASMTSDGGDTYAATIPAQADGSTVSYYVQASDSQGFTVADPANAPAAVYSYVVGYEAPTLALNELMADNDTILEDPDEPEDYPDWIEIYNPGTEAIDLGGLYLTDDLEDLTQFEIPAGVTAPAGGFLLFFADNDTEQGDQHTNFKLSADGESVALVGADGITLIDVVTFGEQTTDVAYGRETDGTGAWSTLDEATPGWSNGGAVAEAYALYLPCVIISGD